MTSDLVFSAILGMALFFVGLWALILAIGFVLSWREDLGDATNCSTTAVTPAIKR